MMESVKNMLNGTYTEAVKEIEEYIITAINKNGKPNSEQVKERICIIKCILNKPDKSTPITTETIKSELSAYGIDINCQKIANVHNKMQRFIGYEKLKKRPNDICTYFFRSDIAKEFDETFAEELGQLKEYYKKHTEEWEDEELRKYHEDYIEITEPIGLKYILNEILNENMESEANKKKSKDIIISNPHLSFLAASPNP